MLFVKVDPSTWIARRLESTANPSRSSDLLSYFVDLFRDFWEKLLRLCYLFAVKAFAFGYSSAPNLSA